MENKLNILFLASWFPSEKNWFDGDFVERHAKSVALKHHVTVVYVQSLEGIKEERKEIVDENNLKIIRIYFPKKSRIQNQLSKFSLYIQTINQIKNIDLIHVNVSFPVGIIALFYKLKSKIPYVITEHWTGYLPIDLTKISYVEKFLTKLIVKNASYLLPVSDNLGNAMHDLGLKNKTTTIRNVIDFDVFKFQNFRNDSVVKFLHISNLSFQKNIEGMLNVVEKLWDNGYDFEFHIGGNGDLGKIIEFKKKTKFSAKLIVFDSLTQKQVSEKMNEADCFILFSRYENQPCVQTEAFASGLPIIATNVGGINEVFPEGFGQIISPNSEDELYFSMQQIIENKFALKSKSEIHQFAKDNFSMKKISEDFDEIYKKVLR